MFVRLVEKWSDLPELKVTVDNPAIIAPLGYGMLRDKLPLATIGNFEVAFLVRRYFPQAKIVFGNSCHCFPGSDILERKLKLAWLAGNNVRPDSFLDVGSITNTVTEAEKIRDALHARGINPKEIILITGQMHARYAVLVWKKTFPDAKIALAVTRYHYEYESGHTILLQRNMYVLFAARVAQYEIARYGGIDLFRKIKHPVSKIA